MFGVLVIFIFVFDVALVLKLGFEDALRIELELMGGKVCGKLLVNGETWGD